MGVYVEDRQAPNLPARRWFQNELRNGIFRPVMDKFTRDQPEQPDAGKALVEKVDDLGVTGRIPCYAYDHESPHPFATEVRFRFDPSSGRLCRLS